MVTYDCLVHPTEPAELGDLLVSGRGVLDECRDHVGHCGLAEIVGDGLVDVRSALQDFDVVLLLFRSRIVVFQHGQQRLCDCFG